MKNMTEQMLQELEKELSGELKELQTATLSAASRILLRDVKLQSLHGIIGGKNNTYTDVIHTVFTSPDSFIASWYSGLLAAVAEKEKLQRRYTGHVDQNTTQHDHLRLAKDPVVRRYLETFLTRNFYREFTARTRSKPQQIHASLWFGNNKMPWGLLIAPAFRDGDWTNDVSEIRRADYSYWTIGHVLSTGLIDPTSNDVMPINDVRQLITFCRTVLKRNSVSIYEREIWDQYTQYLQKSTDPASEPFLIPELRYAGRATKHEYRLDFTVLNAHTQSFVGFEFSPQSTHMHVEGKAKTLKKHNEELRAKWDRESTKRNQYFSEFGITTITFSDQHLADVDSCFGQIKIYLEQRGDPLALLATQRSRIDSFMLA